MRQSLPLIRGSSIVRSLALARLVPIRTDQDMIF